MVPGVLRFTPRPRHGTLSGSRWPRYRLEAHTMSRRLDCYGRSHMVRAALNRGNRLDITGQTLKGQTKSIAVDEEGVTISYRVLYHGFKGDKRIPFSSITAVQFMEPGGWLAGHIQFTIHGGREWTGQVNQDENAAQFDRKEADNFRALRDLAQARCGRLASADRDASAGGVSVADELMKLATLREQGILTEDEFAAQQAKLLG